MKLFIESDHTNNLSELYQWHEIPCNFLAHITKCCVLNHLISEPYVDAEFVWRCRMAWEEREVVVIVVHHLGVEDHFTQRIAAMNVVNVGIMLEIATVTGVAVEGAGAGMHVVYPLCLFFFGSFSV